MTPLFQLLSVLALIIAHAAANVHSCPSTTIMQKSDTQLADGVEDEISFMQSTVTYEKSASVKSTGTSFLQKSKEISKHENKQRNAGFKNPQSRNALLSRASEEEFALEEELALEERGGEEEAEGGGEGGGGEEEAQEEEEASEKEALEEKELEKEVLEKEALTLEEEERRGGGEEEEGGGEEGKTEEEALQEKIGLDKELALEEGGGEEEEAEGGVEAGGEEEAQEEEASEKEALEEEELEKQALEKEALTEEEGGEGEELTYYSEEEEGEGEEEKTEEEEALQEKMALEEERRGEEEEEVNTLRRLQPRKKKKKKKKKKKERAPALMPKASVSSLVDGKAHKFGLEGNQFVWDGKPVLLQAGELHYFRIPSAYWKDRLLRVKALGLNAISTYVPWNFHEQDEGTFDFTSEMHDLQKFLRLAKNLQLAVIFRPGPYICAEWTAGGLPSWLLAKSGMELRTYEAPYIQAVEKWWSNLLPLVRPELLENGGAIAMVQLENEFGAIGRAVDDRDRMYMQHLRDLAVKHLGQQVLLFTCDGFQSEQQLQDGGLDGIFHAVNLKPEEILDDYKWENAVMLQSRLNRKTQGPMYVAETYAGWFTPWTARRVEQRSTSELVDAIQKMIQHRASFCLYMAHGGTNFGFWAGSNPGPLTTSYDYNSPISEAGRHGQGQEGADKFEALREVLSEGRKIPAEPNPLPLSDFGEVRMVRAAPLRKQVDHLCHRGWQGQGTTMPRPVEFHGQIVGPAMYRYKWKLAATILLQKSKRRSRKLSAKMDEHSFSSALEQMDSCVSGRANLDLGPDPAFIWMNNHFIDQTSDGGDDISQRRAAFKIPGHCTVPKVLDVLVDVHGRRNWGEQRQDISDMRGLHGVQFGGSLLETGSLGEWSVCELRLTNASALSHVAKQRMRSRFSAEAEGPVFWVGKLNVGEALADSFLQLGDGWESGVAFINGFNLGRYRSEDSPVRDLYVPAPFLRKHVNEVLLLEMGHSARSSDKHRWISFKDKRAVSTDFSW